MLAIIVTMSGHVTADGRFKFEANQVQSREGCGDAAGPVSLPHNSV
jgi:hypothetical protein